MLKHEVLREVLDACEPYKVDDNWRFVPVDADARIIPDAQTLDTKLRSACSTDDLIRG